MNPVAIQASFMNSSCSRELLGFTVCLNFYKNIYIYFQHQVAACVNSQFAAMAIPDDVVKKVKSIISDAEEGERFVKSVHSALKELEGSGHLYKMLIHCRHVGCHPQNRDGSGINGIDVHGLLDDIVTAGFVQDRVSAIAVEVGDNSELVFNQTLVEAHGGQLGSMDTSQLKVLSLAGSHTNFVMRLFDQEVVHDNEKVCANGKLSKEMLARHDPQFHEAVISGYQWRVLSSHVTKQIPELLTMVQRTGNATLARGEHELQLLRRLHGIWVSQSQLPSTVSYEKVKRIASPGLSPSLLKTLPHLFTFALKASGGITPWLLQETEAFVRAHASSTKTLGSELWQALGQDVKGQTQVLRFRHSMVTCQHYV